jgi:hypothetical protein
VTPSASELRTLELLGLEPSLLAELRSAAGSSPPNPASGISGGSRVSGVSASDAGSEVPLRGRPSSLSSAGVAEEALGGMRLSGLDPALRERLKEQVREGRESGLGDTLPRLSTESSASSLGGLMTPGGYSALGDGRPSINAEAEAEVQAWLEKEAALRAAGGGASSSSAADVGAASGGAAAQRHSSEGGGDCAACAELRAKYAEHDEWLDSLQKAAEGVVAANQQAQALADKELPAPVDTPKPP